MFVTSFNSKNYIFNLLLSSPRKLMSNPTTQQNGSQEDQNITPTQNPEGEAPIVPPGGAAPEVKDLKPTLSKIEDKLHRYMKQAFVLVNLYYFFQGAVLTAVSQVSSPKCKQWYFFLVLSILPFLVNAIPLIYVLYKCAKAKNEHDTYAILNERNRLGQGSGQPMAATTDEYWKWIRYGGVGFAALILIGFNAVMLYGCHSLLCENSVMSTNINFDGDCFKVCNNENKCLKICTE